MVLLQTKQLWSYWSASISLCLICHLPVYVDPNFDDEMNVNMRGNALYEKNILSDFSLLPPQRAITYTANDA